MKYFLIGVLTILLIPVWMPIAILRIMMMGIYEVGRGASDEINEWLCLLLKSWADRIDCALRKKMSESTKKGESL